MADALKEKTINVSPVGHSPGSKAFGALQELEAEHRRICGEFRESLAKVLDQGFLTHMTPSQVGDTAQRFVKKVVNKWQHQMNVEKLDGVTKAVDMV